MIGNIVCIILLTWKKKELGLKPSFTDLLIFLVTQTFELEIITRS